MVGCVEAVSPPESKLQRMEGNSASASGGAEEKKRAEESEDEIISAAPAAPVRVKKRKVETQLERELQQLCCCIISSDGGRWANMDLKCRDEVNSICDYDYDWDERHGATLLLRGATVVNWAVLRGATEVNEQCEVLFKSLHQQRHI